MTTRVLGLCILLGCVRQGGLGDTLTGVATTIPEDPRTEITIAIRDSAAATTTLDDGTYTLSQVPRGNIILRFSAEGFASRDVAVSFAGGDLELPTVELHAGRRLVTDPQARWRALSRDSTIAVFYSPAHGLQMRTADGALHVLSDADANVVITEDSSTVVIGPIGGEVSVWNSRGHLVTTLHAAMAAWPNKTGSRILVLRNYWEETDGDLFEVELPSGQETFVGRAGLAQPFFTDTEGEYFYLASTDLGRIEGPLRLKLPNAEPAELAASAGNVFGTLKQGRYVYFFANYDEFSKVGDLTLWDRQTQTQIPVRTNVSARLFHATDSVLAFLRNSNFITTVADVEVFDVDTLTTTLLQASAQVQFRMLLDGTGRFVSWGGSLHTAFLYDRADQSLVSFPVGTIVCDAGLLVQTSSGSLQVYDGATKTTTNRGIEFDGIGTSFGCILPGLLIYRASGQTHALDVRDPTATPVVLGPASSYVVQAAYANQEGASAFLLSSASGATVTLLNSPGTVVRFTGNFVSGPSPYQLLVAEDGVAFNVEAPINQEQTQSGIYFATWPP